MNEAVSLSDYIEILKRRRWYVIIPAVVIIVIAAAVAFLLPPVYESTATILIESPDVPPQLVASTITGYAEQQIQAINQRVTSTQRLVDIINRYNLYPQKRQSEPVFAVADDMRDSIGLSLISAQVGAGPGKSSITGAAPNPGGPQTTVAFTLSFDYFDPAMAQRVTNELVSLYLSENARSRQEKASETTAFLASEAERLERKISELDKQLSDLKQKYQGSLPEQMQHNLDTISRNETEQRTLDQRLQALNERKIYLQTELLKIDPNMTGGDGTQAMANTPAGQLQAMRTQLVVLSGRYGPDHPDVVKLRREVEALEKEQGGGPDVGGLEAERERLQNNLTLIEEKYAPDHPDVVNLKRQLASIDKELQTAAEKGGRPGSGSGRDTPANPVYIELQGQLKSAEAEMAAITTQREEVTKAIANIEKLVLQTPIVERDYRRLSREYESALSDYSAIKEKQKAAQMGEALETERKGERFTLIDPPQVPTQPIKPNRLAVLGLGGALAIAIGAGCAIIAEAADSAVHGVRQLVAITGVTPLAVIPYIRTRADIRKTRRERVIYTGLATALLFAIVAFVHFQIMPLDVLWTTVQRQLQGVPVLSRLVAKL